MPIQQDILRKFNLRATNERIAVVGYFNRNKKPKNLKEILKDISRQGIHEATLYRILASFREVGLVRQIDFGEAVPYFELADNEHDHHHIVCTKCKKVNDFVGCEVDKLIKKALSQTKDFHSVNKHSFELFGLCKKCAK